MGLTLVPLQLADFSPKSFLASHHPLQDCFKSDPRYFSEVLFTANIQHEDSIDESVVIAEFRKRMPNFVDTGRLKDIFDRLGFSQAQSISSEFFPCVIKTEGPSSVPSILTATPSFVKPPNSVSLLFQIGLSGGKTSAENSECCRTNIVNGAKASLNKVLDGLSGRRLNLSTNNYLQTLSIQNEVSIQQQNERTLQRAEYTVKVGLIRLYDEIGKFSQMNDF